MRIIQGKIAAFVLVLASACVSDSNADAKRNSANATTSASAGAPSFDTSAGARAQEAGDGEVVDPLPLDPSWVEYRTKCKYSFHAPAGFTETKVQGTDSCVVQYEGGGCSYDGDYGLYSGSLDNFASEPGYRVTKVQLDKRSDRIATLIMTGPRTVQNQPPFLAGVHVDISISIALNFFGRCNSEADQAIAARVLQTLRFEE